MTQLTLYIYTLISSIIFLQMNHPMAMGLMLLIQTFLICMLSGIITKTFWFSYVLFLIFLGGMLVLFIYVTSLASNEMFSLSMKLMIMAIMLIMLLLTIMIFMDKTIMTNFLNNLDNSSIKEMTSYFNENTISLNKLYNFPTNLITIMLINYLLLTLIAIVKITNTFFGPLRPMNN
uniref:NADH-ubiquinone oxidoreductase chain 6 n=1 Tax=Heterostomus curvipalpis TaxID=857307 RepID=A0A3G5FPQ8_9DIPT|nr:NADH dehydrogenase subunit 6 [Heterostomus curvipalpis]UDF83779.1 NADH dehydrogenase subunit 6 [Heterostomus curvipalpis]